MSEEPHQRRPRYTGKNPRRFEEKYKELDPVRHPETIAKVRASGKTPAGQHVPIMVAEILECLAPQPGEKVMDCTLGYGGHARELLKAVQPGGTLIGLDLDPVELAATEARMQGESGFIARRINFAGLARVIAEQGWDGADVILADLGASSMQLDNPARGFSYKHEGPLDMRMNPERGISARDLLRKLTPEKLKALLTANSDEPRAEILATVLAGRDFPTTLKLTAAIQAASPAGHAEETLPRVFQALRIAVNEEFTAIDAFLRDLHKCLRPGGRVAILTFHSGEDRRVKHAFRDAFRGGIYEEINDEVIRPSSEEVRDNPRSASAKLRWARRAP